MAQSKTISREQIEALKKSFANMPEKKDRAFNLKEGFKELEPTIQAMLKKGYTYKDISEQIAKCIQLDISPNSIKTYLNANRKQEKQRKTDSSSPRSMNDAQPATENLSGTAVNSGDTTQREGSEAKTPKGHFKVPKDTDEL